MAQSASNLTITIGADSSKLRADLAVVKAELRDLTKQQNAAAQAFRATGNNTQLLAISSQVETLTLRQRGLTTAISTNTKTTSEAATANKSLSATYTTIGENLTTVAAGFRTLRFGIAAVIAEKAIAGVGKEVTNVVDRFSELQRVSTATGFDTQVIQEFQEALKLTGVEGENASKFLFSLSNAFNAAQLAAQRASESFGKVRLLRGGRGRDPFEEFAPGAPTVFRAGKGGAPPAIASQEQALKALNIQAEDYTNSLDDQRKKLTDIGAGLAKLRDAGQLPFANEVAKSLFAGAKGFREVLDAIDLLSKGGNLKDIQEGLARTGQLIKPEDKKPLEDLRGAIDDVGDAWEGAIKTKVVGSAPALTAALQGTANAIIEVPKTISQSFDEFNKSVFEGTNLALGNVKSAWGDLPNFFSKLGADVTSSFNAQLDTLGQNVPGFIKSIQDAIKNIPSPQTQGTVEVPGQGFAGGGSIRGPGTGTSDSILARLSTGEFVMQARAVRRWGVGMMHALNNGFAMGGLVGPQPIGFAAGGLVSNASSSGRAVHLHLGGQSFPLSGSTAVVDALVSHAHSQQIRSTGVKPSWFAARPSGR